MAPVKHLFKKMFDNLNEQKKNINRFYLVAQQTITDIYRANSYADQITGILKKIDSLLTICEKLRPMVQAFTPENQKAKEYAQLLNNIKVELNYLKATSQAMDEQLKEIKQVGDIERTIAGNMVGLKKQINRTIKKVEQVLDSS